MTELVQNHLRQTIIGIQMLLTTQRERAFAIPRRISISRAHNSDTEPGCGL